MTSREFRQRVEYAGVRAALSLAGRVPIEAGQRFGAMVGRMGFDVARARRDVSVTNVERALGVSRAEATRIARASYENLGRCMMEFSAFARFTREDVLALVSVEGMEHFDRVRGEGNGGVLVSGHLGNWELIAATFRAMDRPVHGLIGQQSNARVDQVMNELRGRQGVPLITRAVALRKVLTVLKSGEFVVMLADQDARKGGVFVEFLGRPAATVRGPAMFAIRNSCPVIPVFMSRVGTRHRMTIESPVYPTTFPDEEDAVRDITQRYTDRLAARIREHPEEYFWGHRRWKTQPAQLPPAESVRRAP